MREYLKFYIGGRWVESTGRRTFEVINPASEAVAGRIALGEKDDVDHAVRAAHEALDAYSRSSREERLDLIRRIQQAFEARRADLSTALTDELGNAPWLIADGQLALPAGHIKIALEVLETFPFEKLSGSTLVRKEPIGVCALITPWNWPLLTTMTKILPALATGCTVVWKPSEYAPFSAQVLAEVFDAARVPPGVINMVFGDGPTVGAALSQHPAVDMVSFTGSTRAGIEVARNAAPTVKRVHQELGGKGPNVLLEDADINKAVPSGVRYVTLNAGQNCTAPTRLLAPRSRLSAVVAIAKATAESLTVGPPASNAFVGPVINSNQWNRIQGLIQKGIEEGATLVLGGPGRPEGLERGYFVKPTIFTDVSNDMTIAREEIFGPVLVIIPYDDVEEAVRIANDSPYGLAAYVHSRDLQKAREVGSRIRAGQVFINGDMDLMDLNAPFGGRKMSGNGREFGASGFEAFLEEVAYIGYQPNAA
jgi:aldehyde dehydrogenase (NAD+)